MASASCEPDGTWTLVRDELDPARMRRVEAYLPELDALRERRGSSTLAGEERGGNVMGIILGAVFGALAGGITLYILSVGAKKLVPQAREAITARPEGLTMEELGEAVGLTGTFQRGKLQQLAQHLVADGVEATTGEDGVTRYRSRS
jgi:hypothetical protein